MSLILRLIAAVVGGFAAHRLYTPSLSMGPRWGSMFRYAVGMITTLPFLLMVHHAIKSDSDDERLLTAFLLTIGAVGSGTFVGHWSDTVSGGDK